MSKSTKDLVTVQGTVIGVVQQDNQDYISLTDISKYKNAEHPDDVIRNWLRNRNTLELLGVWERLHFSELADWRHSMKVFLDDERSTPEGWVRVH